MSDFKTLAYDLYKIRGESRPLAICQLPDASLMSPSPYVNIERNRFVKWSNDYKVLAEFATEVLQKPDFTIWDLLTWYRQRAAELEKKARDIQDGKNL